MPLRAYVGTDSSAGTDRCGLLVVRLGSGCSHVEQFAAVNLQVNWDIWLFGRRMITFRNGGLLLHSVTVYFTESSDSFEVFTTLTVTGAHKHYCACPRVVSLPA